MVELPIRQSSIWCSHCLRVKPCDFLSKKGEKIENQTMHIMRNASVQYPDTFFPKNALRTPSTTCERSICAMWWPSVSMQCISVYENTILPCFPIWWSGTKVMTLLDWSTTTNQICIKSDLEVAKKLQVWKTKKASGHDENKKFFTKWWLKSVKETIKTCIKTLKKHNCKDTNSNSDMKMNTIAWKMLG